MQLRDYQQNAYDRSLALVKKRKSPLVVIGTGGGKTAVSSALTLSGIKAGKRVIIAVPLTQLIEQHVTTLKNFGIHPDQIGILQGKNSDSDQHLSQCAIVVAMAQSLPGARGREMLKRSQFDICIQDEKHLAWLDTAQALIRAPFNIAFTATPLRDGNQETLNDYEWIEPISTRELIQQGRLTKFKHYLYRQTVQLQSPNRDYTLAEQQAILKNITPEFVFNQWCNTRSSKDYTLGFCASIEQAKEYARHFNRQGCKAAVCCEETPDKDRSLKDGTVIKGFESIKQDFRVGKIKVIFSVVRLATGYDEPLAKCSLILRPTKSLALWFQIFGRVLRPIPEMITQPIAQILDFAGCGVRLPLPTEIDSFQEYLKSQTKIVRQAGNITTERVQSQPALPVFRDLASGSMVPQQDPRLIADDVELLRELRHQAFWVYCCSPSFAWKVFNQLREAEPHPHHFKGCDRVLENSIFTKPTVESFLAYMAYLKAYTHERSRPEQWMLEEIKKEFGIQGQIWLRQYSLI